MKKDEIAAAAGVPPGFVLVPREPTRAMFDAFYDAPVTDDSDTSDWLKSYRAMLAASGAPTGAPTEGEKQKQHDSVHLAAPQTSNEQQSLVHQAVSTSSTPKGVHSGDAPASAPLAGGSDA